MSNISNTPERAGGNLTAQALREGFYAGIISLGLFVLFVGLETTQNIRNELVLNQRWGLLAVFVIVAAVGRFLAVAYLRPWLAARKANAAAKPETEGEQSFFKRNLSTIAIVVLLIYPPLMVMIFGVQGSLKWVDNFGIQILIYVMLAWGLNIVVGLAGLLDLGYVAFYAVGAYSYALLSQYFGLSFWALLPLAGILAAFWGMILGFPVLRLKGDYLAIVTLAFGEIIRLVLINWTEVTKGTFGVSGIPKASVFGIWSFDVSAPNNFAKVFGLPMSSAYY
ncbi:MAG: ABC transporter permease subunit, partial [Shinella sp.]